MLVAPLNSATSPHPCDPTGNTSPGSAAFVAGTVAAEAADQQARLAAAIADEGDDETYIQVCVCGCVCVWVHQLNRKWQRQRGSYS